jgi:hypothetical protein
LVGVCHRTRRSCGEFRQRGAEAGTRQGLGHGTWGRGKRQSRFTGQGGRRSGENFRTPGRRLTDLALSPRGDGTGPTRADRRHFLERRFGPVYESPTFRPELIQETSLRAGEGREGHAIVPASTSR